MQEEKSYKDMRYISLLIAELDKALNRSEEEINYTEVCNILKILLDTDVGTNYLKDVINKIRPYVIYNKELRLIFIIILRSFVYETKILDHLCLPFPLNRFGHVVYEDVRELQFRQDMFKNYDDYLYRYCSQVPEALNDQDFVNKLDQNRHVYATDFYESGEWFKIIQDKYTNFVENLVCKNEHEFLRLNVPDGVDKDYRIIYDAYNYIIDLMNGEATSSFKYEEDNENIWLFITFGVWLVDALAKKEHRSGIMNEFLDKFDIISSHFFYQLCFSENIEICKINIGEWFRLQYFSMKNVSVKNSVYRRNSYKFSIEFILEDCFSAESSQVQLGSKKEVGWTSMDVDFLIRDLICNSGVTNPRSKSIRNLINQVRPYVNSNEILYSRFSWMLGIYDSEIFKNNKDITPFLEPFYYRSLNFSKDMLDKVYDFWDLFFSQVPEALNDEDFINKDRDHLFSCATVFYESGEWFTIIQDKYTNFVENLICKNEHEFLGLDVPYGVDKDYRIIYDAYNYIVDLMNGETTSSFKYKEDNENILLFITFGVWLVDALAKKEDRSVIMRRFLGGFPTEKCFFYELCFFENIQIYNINIGQLLELFDVDECYWEEMSDFGGINIGQLPKLFDVDECYGEEMSDCGGKARDLEKRPMGGEPQQEIEVSPMPYFKGDSTPPLVHRKEYTPDNSGHKKQKNNISYNSIILILLLIIGIVASLSLYTSINVLALLAIPAVYHSFISNAGLGLAVLSSLMLVFKAGLKPNKSSGVIPAPGALHSIDVKKEVPIGKTPDSRDCNPERGQSYVPV